MKKTMVTMMMKIAMALFYTGFLLSESGFVPESLQPFYIFQTDENHEEEEEEDYPICLIISTNDKY